MEAIPLLPLMGKGPGSTLPIWINRLILVKESTLKTDLLWDSLVVQCLRLHVPNAGGPSLNPGQRTKRHGFDPWVRKMPWRRKWQPTLVFWPGKSHRQRSLAGSSQWSGKELYTTQQLNNNCVPSHIQVITEVSNILLFVQWQLYLLTTISVVTVFKQ